MSKSKITRRRVLLALGGSAAAVGTLAAPAIAQGQPSVAWRLTSSFPKATDVLFGRSEAIAQRVSVLTDGRFKIQPFAAGEIVRGLQVLDSVQTGTVELGHTVGYYYVGKTPALAFDTSIPFGLNSRQQLAWIFHGGGLELVREVYAGFNVINFPGAQTGTQMGGWFRKEIKGVADLKGLKMRVPGMAGAILARIGVVPQQLAAGDIYPALERGTLDAVEWVGPHDDAKLGFVRVAKYYYAPGFWEPTATASFIVNRDAWSALPPAYQSAFEIAATEVSLRMLPEYDAKNAAALRGVVAAGAELRYFPKEVLDEGFKAAVAYYGELSQSNPQFKKVFDHYWAYRSASADWLRICEHVNDGFNFAAKG